jgi:uncharacterized membrane protein HdeD (DUF308 family)
MTDRLLSWIYGFSLVGIIAVLVGIIALGRVEANTSAGLQQLIGILAVLSGGWSNRMFGSHGPPSNGQPKE